MVRELCREGGSAACQGPGGLAGRMGKGPQVGGWRGARHQGGGSSLWNMAEDPRGGSWVRQTQEVLNKYFFVCGAQHTKHHRE